MTEEGSVAIVGSCNMDLVCYVDRHPNEGETLIAKKYEQNCGGKGSNQAVMVAKLMEKKKTVFISAVGDDAFGNIMKENCKKFNMHNVDKNVHVFKNISSGVANIIVEKSGSNRIIIVPGANLLLTPEHIDESFEDIKGCDVLVCQNEIKLETTVYALKKAKEAGLITIFNPAPATTDIPDEAYKYSDIVCPNETEAEIITGVKVETIDDAKKAASIIKSKGAKDVVITLGSKGCVLLDKDGNFTHFKGKEVPKEKIADTTGAGDSFIGSLAYFMACKRKITDALQLANYIASISIQSYGTQISYPDRTALSFDDAFR